jgi:hypothetical protein
MGVVVAVLLQGVGLWKRFARTTVLVLLGLPGGAWSVAGVLGVVTVCGWVGSFRFSDSSRAPGPDTTNLRRAAWAVGTAACWTVAFAAPMYVLSGLPSRNCRSNAACGYIPGTGSLFLVYAVTVAGVGFGWYRWRRAVDEKRGAEERARLKRLRKKGKGKARAARGR